MSPLNVVTPLKNRVMLVMPWHKNVSPQTSFCVTQLADKRRTSSLLNFGDAFVAHTRNTCADLFLASDFEWMLTIDDDMIVPFGNARWFNAHTAFDFKEPFCSFNAIDRLLSHQKTLVGALYFGRWPKAGPVYGEGLHTQELEFVKRAPMDVCKPTRWVGTGCLLIHRSVFTDIEKRFPNLSRGPNGKGGNWFSTSEHCAIDGIRQVREMLSSGPMTSEKCCRAYEMLLGLEQDAKANSSLGMGEDVSFCIRANQSGHQPHVDMGLVCGHIGSHVFGPSNLSQ
jgi:hypothetical protein